MSHLNAARSTIFEEQSQYLAPQPVQISGGLQAPLAVQAVACGDPGAARQVNPGLGRTSEDIASLRKKFSFLKDFSDQFIQTTPLDVLLKTETTAMKPKDLERNRSSGTRLSNNRDELPTTFYSVPAGRDNRWDNLHEARFLPGACCSAGQHWTRAREVLGDKVFPGVSDPIPLCGALNQPVFRCNIGR
jgi:hypothetical protein